MSTNRTHSDLLKLGKDEKDRERIKKLVASSGLFIDLLQQMLDDKINQRSQTKEADYDKEAWAYFQADRNGQLRMLRELKTILTLTNNKDVK